MSNNVEERKKCKNTPQRNEHIFHGCMIPKPHGMKSIFMKSYLCWCVHSFVDNWENYHILKFGGGKNNNSIFYLLPCISCVISYSHVRFDGGNGGDDDGAGNDALIHDLNYPLSDISECFVRKNWYDDNTMRVYNWQKKTILFKKKTSIGTEIP